MDENTRDPGYHVDNIRRMLGEAEEHARRDARLVEEPRAKALFETTVALGGTLTGEHGIGIMKAPYLPLEQSASVIALQERVKALFDPQGILNPGKIFPAHAGRYHTAC